VNGGIFGYSVIIRKHLKNIIMAATDSPLKRLVTTFIDDFATWLLESEVDSVTPHNIELYAKPDPVRADEVFTVKLASGRTIILHIEFQGRRSEIPMPLRELDSLSRLALKFQDMELYSVVFYVGKGAGQDDTGIHEITNPKGEITLNWQYKVIRLWFRGFSFFSKN
jgi:predicted transposase YdaD